MKPMKTILFLFFASFSISAFSQIQQNVNKTTGTVSKPITQIDSIRFNTNTNQMEIIQTNGNAENHVISDVINVTFSGQLVGTIATLGCGTATNTGTLTAYSAASGVSSSIPYTGGNGGSYNGQNINSTGVTGLTATLTAGTFAVGTGNLIYTITGTPNSSGTANFSINIGGKSCILQRTVILPIGTISVLNCGNATNNGTLYDGTAASGVSSTISYSGGNGGTHNGQVVASTGVTGLTATLTAGNFAVGSGSLNYTISGTPDTSGIASFLLDIGGQICELTINVNLPIGTISLLDCGNATNSGSLTAYSAANGVSSSIPYSGGNGGTYNLQSVTSTGVTGLTATIVADTFALGSGNLIYTISGTPSAGGNASFLLNIGGQSCTLTLNVNLPIGIINTLVCGSSTNSGSLFAYTAASGVSSSIPYSGGNGGTHNGQTVTSTGVTGLTATLSPGTFAIGSGNLIYTISGTPSSEGTASFLLSIGGNTCTLNRTISLPVGIVTTLSCSNANNNGSLVAYSLSNGVSATIPYSGGNGGTYSSQSSSSTGVTGLTANLSSGTLNIGSGNITYTITGTPSSSGTASFAISIGGQTCNFTFPVYLPEGTISMLNCGTSTLSGTLIPGNAANGVSISIPFNGGNGGTYVSQSISSTGITGLTASLPPGTFSIGSGSLTFTITGIPSASGTATFAINIGGQSCVLSVNIAAQPQYPANSVFCNGTTLVIEVTNPTTGKIWMDRNLGASQVAANSNDPNSYGDLYQWGRRSDGHQCRNSATTTTISQFTNQPAHGDFILTSSSPYDWLYPQNNNLWQGINGVNNPCPNGYRIPTIFELDAERLSWNNNNSSGAFNSPLKLPIGGYRIGTSGSLNFSGGGIYWSSSIQTDFTRSRAIVIAVGNSYLSLGSRGEGYSVRCIKN
jgi:hypothetical protein